MEAASSNRALIAGAVWLVYRAVGLCAAERTRVSDKNLAASFAMLIAGVEWDIWQASLTLTIAIVVSTVFWALVWEVR
jgi:hypothetical protein